MNSMTSCPSRNTRRRYCSLSSPSEMSTPSHVSASRRPRLIHYLPSFCCFLPSQMTGLKRPQTTRAKIPNVLTICRVVIGPSRWPKPICALGRSIFLAHRQLINACMQQNKISPLCPSLMIFCVGPKFSTHQIRKAIGVCDRSSTD